MSFPVGGNASNGTPTGARLPRQGVNVFDCSSVIPPNESVLAVCQPQHRASSLGKEFGRHATVLNLFSSGGSSAERAFFWRGGIDPFSLYARNLTRPLILEGLVFRGKPYPSPWWLWKCVNPASVAGFPSASFPRPSSGFWPFW